MSSNLEKKYPSKILLIGEYAVLYGGQALSIPNWDYFGSWKFGENTFPSLMSLLEFLNSNSKLKSVLNLEAFRQDIEKSIHFNSNISFGYGLGSSGVLTAAIYDRYCTEVGDDLMSIRNQLADIESFFHGSSSGLDPLVSYTAKVVVSDQSNCSMLEDINPFISDYYKLSLIDSGLTRNTRLLVQKFQNLMSDSEFKNGYFNEIMKINSLTIQSILEKDHLQFMNAWKELSKKSLYYFENMIPMEILKIWKEGIESEKFYLKLCGAGGGGLFLKMEPQPLF
ncbi:MAG: hypothetical protein ABI851_01495 [Saprospiraceae bacterium]